MASEMEILPDTQWHGLPFCACQYDTGTHIAPYANSTGLAAIYQFHRINKQPDGSVIGIDVSLVLGF